MKKRDFDTFISSNLKGLSIEQQEILLIKISNWTLQRRKKLKERINKSYLFCDKCHKYSLKTRMKIKSRLETVKNKLIFSDAGYGDNDIYADVTYNIYDYVCPYCGASIEKIKFEVDTTNEHNRYGEKI